MKPVDVKGKAYIDSSNKDPKFQFGDHVRISNAKTSLLKDILQIGLNKFF